MTSPPVLFLHGIRGSRLARHGPDEPVVIWELANETHAEGHLLALHQDICGALCPADPEHPLFPLDLEPEVYGRFLHWAAARGPLIAPVWDWRQAPAVATQQIIPHLPEGPLDVVIHSMGLHVLAELVLGGALPMNRIRRVVLVAPVFGGALDILHVLLSGCDREAECGDATGRTYGALVRGMPALYRLLPVPGHGLLSGEDGRELDPLELALWPADTLGEGERHRHSLARLLHDALGDRARLTIFAKRLADLGDRVLIVAGRGVPTPVHCRMVGAGLSCSASRLELAPDGDGRLALVAQQPLDHALPIQVFGSDEDPVAHGEILRRPEILQRIGLHLSA